MSRRKKSGNGRISVHTPEIIDDILCESNEHESQKDQRRSNRRSNSATNRSLLRSPEDASKHLVSTTEQTCKIQNWLSEKSVRHIQEKTDFESRPTKNMYTTLLENEGSFVKDVDKYLDYKSFLEKRKKQMLYKKWSERVYFPVKEQIDYEMNGPNYRNLDKRKRTVYKHYLDYSNKKGVVFLDVISPGEYDPLVLNANRPAPLKAITSELDDCLIAQSKSRKNEDKAIKRCITGENKPDSDIEDARLPGRPLVPLGRHGTKCKTWLRMQLHDIDSDVRKRSGQRMAGVYNDSQMDFAELSEAKTSPSLVDVELQSQKKRQYYEKHASTIDFEWPELPSLSGPSNYHPKMTSVLPLGMSGLDYCPEYFTDLNASY